MDPSRRRIPQGTPKDLTQAVDNALMNGPMCDISDRTRQHVRDFLAQKFTAAMMRATQQETRAAIMALWTLVTGEPWPHGGNNDRDQDLGAG